jgi:hypothetical protein
MMLVEPDLDWFRRHPDQRVRVRGPIAGEIPVPLTVPAGHELVVVVKLLARPDGTFDRIRGLVFVQAGLA